MTLAIFPKLNRAAIQRLPCPRCGAAQVGSRIGHTRVDFDEAAGAGPLRGQLLGASRLLPDVSILCASGHIERIAMTGQSAHTPGR